MDNKVFNRIEKKYLIDSKTKKNLLKTIKIHMKEDGYFESDIFNIYFDNDNYDLIVQSIDQPPFKEKLRARSYKGYDRVFLEIKTKIRGKDDNPGYKRRIMITKKDYNSLISKKKTALELVELQTETKHDSQIAKEIDYLINQFDLKPKILVMYHRESYKGEDDLRVTFDERLRYRDDNLKFSHSKNDKIYFEDKRNIIMEIKAHGYLPLWLVKAMSGNKVYPTQFSKIGKIYEKIRKEQNV